MANEKRQVNKPYLDPISFEYDGKEKTPRVINFDRDLMTQSGQTSAKQVGQYSITFSLRTPDSVCWDDESTNEIICEWEIKPQTVQPNKKIITLDMLDTVKEYIDNKDSDAIKSGDFANNKVKLYTNKEKSGSPAIEFDLPEEMFLDQEKTTLVDNFKWDINTYPGSEDPQLNGQPVLVLAVKGDESVNYSFISIQSAFTPYEGGESNTAKTNVEGGTITVDIKLSEEYNNALTVKENGIGVFASDDVDNMLEVKEDGTLYVRAIDPSAGLTFASEDEIKNLFK